MLVAKPKPLLCAHQPAPGGLYLCLCSCDWACLCQSHRRGWGRPSCHCGKHSGRDKGPSRANSRGRNVLGCWWETGSFPRKAEQVVMSRYKHGKLTRLVVHVWNGASHMNEQYFSTVKKLDVKGLSKYPWFYEVISTEKSLDSLL